MATTVPSSEWDDAFLAVCLHEESYKKAPDRQAAVTEYVMIVSCAAKAMDKDFIAVLKPFAAEGAAIRKADPTMTAVVKAMPAYLGLFRPISIFRPVERTLLVACIDSLKHMLTQLTYRVGIGTKIESGEITLGLEVVKLGDDDVILFCLAHEIGHAVCAQVQTTRLVNYAAFRTAIFPDWGIHQGIHLQEYFADAFGALVMVAAGKSDSEIMKASSAGVASEGLTGDHPPDRARKWEIANLLKHIKE